MIDRQLTKLTASAGNLMWGLQEQMSALVGTHIRLEVYPLLQPPLYQELITVVEEDLVGGDDSAG